MLESPCQDLTTTVWRFMRLKLMSQLIYGFSPIRTLMRNGNCTKVTSDRRGNMVMSRLLWPSSDYQTVSWSIINHQINVIPFNFCIYFFASSSLWVLSESKRLIQRFFTLLFLRIRSSKNFSRTYFTHFPQNFEFFRAKISKNKIQYNVMKSRVILNVGWSYRGHRVQQHFVSLPVTTRRSSLQPILSRY